MKRFMRNMLNSTLRIGLVLTLAFAVFGGTSAEAANGPVKVKSGKLAFIVGKVVTMNADDEVINNAVVLVEDHKIVAVGRAKDVEIPDGYHVVERKDLWLVPGMVDCHNHIAGGLSDLNDMVYLTNPGLRTVDTIVPENSNIKKARAGGVTTVLLIPGSGTNLSGFGTICRMAGDTVDEMVVKETGSLKIAQAGNPERYWYRVGRTFMNYNTRQTLEKAQAYHKAWEAFEEGQSSTKPDFNPMYENFRGLFRRDFVASVHTQGYQVLMTTVLMLAKKFNLRTVLDHCTFDAWKVAPLVVADPSIYTINGPRQFYFDRTQRKMMGNAARWWQGGVTKLGINTDAPVVAQEQLSYQAAMACYYGWKPYEALKGVTIVPAEALMVDDAVGSIEVGKDAEFVLWTGDPIDPRSACELTVIRGKIAYDAAEGREF
ncbi:MAG: amidohydrolase family protein [Planctomycetota bacterium]